MDTILISTASSEAQAAQNALYELSKANIERVDIWFSWMLGIAGVLGTFLTIALAAIAYLTWTHIKQAKRANEILEEAERKRVQESGQFIADIVAKQAAMKQRALKQKAELLRSEVAERAYRHRGFSPILFRAEGQNAVYAMDEYGYKHWIPNPPTLIRMGYSGSDIKQITKEELDKIPTGENIPDLSK